MSVCVFCNLNEPLIAENALAFAVRDKHPSRPMHTLIIPKRHMLDVFAMDAAERDAIYALMAVCRDAIRQEDRSVEGFNVISNIGAAAGQTVFHAHVHLVPRRAGDGSLWLARPR